MLKKAVITVSLLGLLFILLGRLLGLSEGRLEKALSVITYPLVKVQQCIVAPFKRWSHRRNVMQALLERYEELTLERDQLLMNLIALQGVKHELEASKELRLYAERFTKDAIIAPILLKNTARTPFMLIDKGATSGVEPGMIATHAHCLVGRVTEVYPLYAKVMLISDQQCPVACYGASTGVKGIHTISKNGVPLLAYVDHRDQVEQGELVLSQGTGGVFPRGFAVGTIDQVDETSYGRTISIRPCVSLDALSYVTLIPHTVHAVN